MQSFCQHEPVAERWGLRGGTTGYQAGAIDAIVAHRRGIIVAPTRSGKTLMAARGLEASLMLALRRDWTARRTALVLAPTTVLLEQIAESFDKIDPAILAAVTIDYECHASLPKIAASGRSYDYVFVDEAHMIGAETWFPALVAVAGRARRKTILFTGTDSREDGRWTDIVDQFGPVIHRVEREEVERGGHRVSATVNWFLWCEQDCYRQAIDEKAREMAQKAWPRQNVAKRRDAYQQMLVGRMAAEARRGDIVSDEVAAIIASAIQSAPRYLGVDGAARAIREGLAMAKHPRPADVVDRLIRAGEAAVRETIERDARYRVFVDTAQKDHKRHRAVGTLARERAEAGEQVLVLVYSKQQMKAIHAECGPRAGMAASGLKDLADTVQAFRERRINVLVATSIADVGLDVPCAGTLVNARGGKGLSAAGTADSPKAQASFQQAMSRVLTACEGKEQASIWDVVDCYHPIGNNHARRRAHAYRAIGFTVTPRQSHAATTARQEPTP